jgi:hypothetical protein
MPRAIGVFRKLDWPILPFPVDYKVPTTGKEDALFGLDWRFNASARLAELDRATKEWIGLFAYRLTGKTASLLPAQMQIEANTRPTSRLSMERIRPRLP